MIEIRYCGVCGDKYLVEKLEKKLENIDEINKIECGSCKMEVKVEEEQIFTEDEDIFDINRILESAKRSIES